MAHLSDALHRPGAIIRYSDSGGDGPAVVFTHGAGMDHSVFAPQLQAVRATGRRAIVHDLRGHGASPLDDGIRFTAADALEDLAAQVARSRPLEVGAARLPRNEVPVGRRTAVVRLAKVADPPIALREGVADVSRVIRRCIVGDDQFEIPQRLIQK